MKITLTGRHIEITPSLRDFTNRKFAKLEDLVPAAKDVHIILTVEKYRHTAEVTFKTQGHAINAKKTTKDMYASIEEAMQAILQQVAKLKDRKATLSSRRHRTKQSSIRGMAAEPVATLPEEAGTPPRRRRFTRMGGYADKPMTQEEAAMELESNGKEAIAFVNANTRAVNVIIKRQDGSFGLIEP